MTKIEAVIPPFGLDEEKVSAARPGLVERCRGSHHTLDFEPPIKRGRRAA